MTPADIARAETAARYAAPVREHVAPVLTRTERVRALIEEVDHFAGFGWPASRIAARVGMTTDALNRALIRAGHPSLKHS